MDSYSTDRRYILILNRSYRKQNFKDDVKGNHDLR